MFAPAILVPLLLLFVVGAYYAAFAGVMRNWQVRLLNSRWYVLALRAFGIWMMVLATAIAYTLAVHQIIHINWHETFEP